MFDGASADYVGFVLSTVRFVRLSWLCCPPPVLAVEVVALFCTQVCRVVLYHSFIFLFLLLRPVPVRMYQTCSSFPLHGHT